jgi:hypothetical protein
MLYLTNQKVKVKRIPLKMSLLLLDLNIWSKFSQQPVGITGWMDDCYGPDTAHAKGRALDIRTRDLKMVESLLQKLDRQEWPYLYGPPDHMDHIHIQTDGVCR